MKYSGYFIFVLSLSPYLSRRKRFPYGFVHLVIAFSTLVSQDTGETARRRFRSASVIGSFAR